MTSTGDQQDVARPTTAPVTADAIAGVPPPHRDATPDRPVADPARAPRADAPAPDRRTRSRWWVRPLVLGAVLAAGAAVALTVDLPSVSDLRATVAGAGWLGPVLFAALYAALTLTPTPATVLSIGAGLLFGVPEGLAVVVAGALVGAASAFGMSRSLGRQAIVRVDSKQLRRLDGLLARRGLLAVISVRLLPVLPFGPLNYACGLTGVATRDYLLGTAIGILPAAAVFVTIGSYGVQPASTPFLLALGGLVLLTFVGVLAGRRRSAVASAAAPSRVPS